MRETLLLAGLKAWRVPSKPPHERWTWELKGWEKSTLADKMPADLRAAIERSIPMPATFAEARAELADWRARNDEMEDAMGTDGRYGGDYGLDLVAVARMEVIREAVEHGMRLSTLPEIVERFRLYREREIDEPKIEEALFRDLKALVAGGAP